MRPSIPPLRPAALALLAAAACSQSLEGPTPAPASVAPQVVCLEQLTTEVVLAGEGFAPLPTGTLSDAPQLALPSVTLTRTQDLAGAKTSDAGVVLPDDPAAPEASRVTWTSQQELSFEVFPELALAPGLYDVTVANASGASATAAGLLLAVPRPTITRIEPDLLCGEKENGLTLTGDFFLRVAGATPVVSIGAAPDAKLYADVALDGCRALPGAAGAEACTSLHLTIPAAELPTGGFSVVLTNPAPAACASTDVQTLAIQPAPRLVRIEPDFACLADGSIEVALTGTAFLTVDGVTPTLTLGDRSYPTVADAATCSAVEVMREVTTSCTRLTATLPQGELPAGAFEARLTNPAPADCTSPEPQPFTVVPAPTLVRVVPDLACLADGDVALRVEGTGLLVVDGVAPALTVGGVVLTTSAVEATCTTLANVRQTVQSCTELTATLARDALPAGTHALSVTNPGPGACVSREATSLRIVDAPVVATIEPPRLCADGTTDVTFTLSGSGFLVVDGAAPTVRVDGRPFASVPTDCAALDGVAEVTQSCTSLAVTIPAGSFATGTFSVVVDNPAPAGCSSSEPTTVTFVGEPLVTAVAPTRICSGGGTLAIDGAGFVDGATVTLAGAPASQVGFVDEASLVATFPPGQLVGGPYDLVVSNAPGCDATFPGVVTVITGPQLFFADPPVVYDGVNTQVLLYATGVTDTVNSISMRPTGTADVPTPLQHSWSAARPNRVQVVVPAGTPPGSYDVLLDDVSDCSAVLVGGLRVTGTLSVSVVSVDPPFGWSAGDTAVTVSGDTPPAAGEVGFVELPRLYLNPRVPSAATVAMPMVAVNQLSSSRLTALVPSGLAVDDYDLIVVNPDGSVGLLPSAFRVTTDPPPTLASLAPGSVANSSAESFTVSGADFRAPTVSLTCADPATGQTTTVAATVDASDASSITATFDASLVANGGLCVVRVTNGDGTWGELSALTVTNPAQNLRTPIAGDDLGVPRRGLGAAAAMITSASRFLYAIGGDDGAGTVHDTIEAAPTDVFGTPGAFVEQRYRLTTPRTDLRVVRVGRYLYAVGGSDGTSPLATIERAYLLDPTERVEITDLELELRAAGAGGLTAGLYYYRVAAVMDAADPKNPDGENLASEGFPVILPDVQGRGFAVTLDWSAQPGAASYRIYRSPAAGAGAGAELLLAEVPSTDRSFVDDGTLLPAGLSPLRAGSTGRWHVVATLSAARAAAGAGAVATPADPTTHLLYVAGGLGDAGQPLASIEALSLLEAPDGAQSVLGVTTSAATLSTAVWRAGLYAVTNDVSPRVLAGAPWIYVAGGSDGAGRNTASGGVDAFAIQPDGTLADAVAVDSMSPARAGFGAAAANNFLHVLGGQGGGASRGMASAEHCGAGRPCTSGGASPPDPPDLVNWTSAGSSLVTARVDLATAVQSGVIYVLGGSDGAVALRSTERTYW